MPRFKTVAVEDSWYTLDTRTGLYVTGNDPECRHCAEVATVTCENDAASVDAGLYDPWFKREELCIH